MSDLEKYRKLSSRISKLKSEVDRDDGRLRQLTEMLKNQHGVESIEEAKAKIPKLESRMKKQETAYNQAVTAFIKKWGAKLAED